MKQILASRILMIGAGFCVLAGVLYAADDLVTEVVGTSEEVVEIAPEEVVHVAEPQTEESVATSTEEIIASSTEVIPVGITQTIVSTSTEELVTPEPDAVLLEESIPEVAIIAPIQLENFTPDRKADFRVPSDCRSYERETFFQSFRECVQFVIEAKAREEYEAAGLELPERLQE